MRFRPAMPFAVLSLSVPAVALAACGGGGDGGGATATDKASGLTVTVADDQVKLKRASGSKSGTGGTSGTVSCTDDYAKLVKATAVPAPSQQWYATTLITWPAGGQETSARLSHKLDHDPQLCVVQSADQSASAVVYFGAKVRAGVTKLQTDDSRAQQAGQASAALQAAAKAATGTVSKGAFPDAKTLVAAVTAQGLYAQPVASTDAIKDAGTLYVVTGKTTNKSLTLALKDNKGVVHTATQGVTGAPKLATVR